jgi:hypothetical protein
LYEKYKDRGLVILGFPCNQVRQYPEAFSSNWSHTQSQFGGQEPGSDDEISQFCELNHGVTFPLVKKSDVNGDNTNEVSPSMYHSRKSIDPVIGIPLAEEGKARYPRSDSHQGAHAFRSKLNNFLTFPVNFSGISKNS